MNGQNDKNEEKRKRQSMDRMLRTIADNSPEHAERALEGMSPEGQESFLKGEA